MSGFHRKAFEEFYENVHLPPEVYVGRSGLNLYRRALGLRDLTEAELDALPRVEFDGGTCIVLRPGCMDGLKP